MGYTFICLDCTNRKDFNEWPICDNSRLRQSEP